MYSIVMMMALTSSADQPAFGRGCHGCCGGCWSSCHGCCGGSYYTCCGGSCCGGCWSSCHGCCGGCWSSCHGCCGGCWSSCHGCCGGGLFSGMFHKHSCCGGGCCGGSCYGGCCGGTVIYGCCGGSCYGGCCGGGVPYGAGFPAAPVVPAAPVTPKADDKKPVEKTEAAPATIVVSLPADATLTVDGRATTSKSDVRRLATPALEAGKEFTYTLTAEIVRDGQKLVATETVTVQAGRESVVTLAPKAETVAAK